MTIDFWEIDKWYQKVKFTEMKDGDKEDYLLLKELEKSYISMTSDRIIEELKRQGTISLEGYQITRLEMDFNQAPELLEMVLILIGL